jgi:hypothetical protein
VTRLAGLLLALLLGACATRPPHPDAFAFAIFGDAPYSAKEEPRFERVIDDINAQPLAFVVNLGDIKGTGPCTDSLYLTRKRQFDRIVHPFHFTPGDNDWVDCRHARNGSSDPLERLARLRRVFYGEAPSASHRLAGLERQAGYPENVRFARGGVVFAVLNVQGSNDNVGFDAPSDAEHAARLKANLAWMAEAVADAERGNSRGLVVIFQANPFLPSKQDVYAPVLAAIRGAASRLRRTVLLIHGDTHWHRVDHPFVEATGQVLPWLRRMETWGSPFVGWVKVTVDPADPELFRFDDRLQ